MANPAQPPRTPPKTIRLLAFDDVDELDVIAPYEMLKTAGVFLKAQAPDVRIVSVAGTTKDPNVVRGIHGITFGTQPWDVNETPDVLIVAGGGYALGIGIITQMNNPDFKAVIQTQHAAKRQLVSVCTGAFGLVGADVVRNRRMTTHPFAVDALAKAGAIVLDPDKEARVVDDGDIISCGGVTSGTDEALYLIEAFWPGNPSLVANVRGIVDYHFVAKVATPAVSA